MDNPVHNRSHLIQVQQRPFGVAGHPARENSRQPSPAARLPASSGWLSVGLEGSLDLQRQPAGRHPVGGVLGGRLSLAHNRGRLRQPFLEYRRVIRQMKRLRKTGTEEGATSLRPHHRSLPYGNTHDPNVGARGTYVRPTTSRSDSRGQTTSRVSIGPRSYRQGRGCLVHGGAPGE